jgi:hypothetical protein
MQMANIKRILLSLLPRHFAMNSKSAALRLRIESALAGRIASPFRQPHVEPPDTVPAGVPILDEATGGLPRGCLTEMYGPPFSGKTSVLQAALATRTANSEACALVDAQDSFDPICANSAGVSLHRLLWIRCKNLDQAFASVDFLLSGGGFGMVAMDLSDVPAQLVRQIPLNVWFRLRRSVENTSTILLILSRESNAKTCASLVLRLEKESAIWSLRERGRSQRSSIAHTPACLLDGWSATGEIIRPGLRHKNIRFLNQPVTADRSQNFPVRFQLQTNRFAQNRPHEFESAISEQERTEGPD